MMLLHYNLHHIGAICFYCFADQTAAVQKRPRLIAFKAGTSIA
jgi:hypothetical protein